MHPWAVEAQAQAAKTLDASYERESTPGDPGTPFRWVVPGSDGQGLSQSTLAGAPPEPVHGVPLGVAWTIAGTPWCLLFAADDIPAVLPHFKLKRRPHGTGFSTSLLVPVVLYRVIEAMIAALTEGNAIDVGGLPEDALREIGYAGALGGHAAAVHLLREVFEVRAYGCRNTTPVRWSLDP